MHPILCNGGAHMLLNSALALVLAAVILTVGWAIKYRLLTPVKVGKNTKITVNVNVNGRAESLEQTLRSLVWLRENGTLKADIVLNVASDDSTACRMAEIYADKYSYIYCSFGDSSWKNSRN